MMRFAFELAQTRREARDFGDEVERNHYTMPFWDERFQAMAREYPHVRTDQYHIDILTAHFVRHPDWFDVVVGSNLLGIFCPIWGRRWWARSGLRVGEFESGKGISVDVRAGPRMGAGHCGERHRKSDWADWSAAMMLRHFGEAEAADAIERAIESVLAGSGPKTPDIGGSARTIDLGEAIAAETAS